MSLPRPAPGDVLQVNIVGFLNEQTCIMTFLYDCATATGSPTLDIQQVGQAIGDDLWDSAVHGLNTICSSDLENVGYTCQIVHPTRTILVSVAPTANAQGSNATPSAPSGVAAVVSRKGIVANRHNLGRFYIPAISQADIQSSAVLVPSQTDTQITALLPRIVATQTVTVGASSSSFFPILAPKPAYSPVVPVSFATFAHALRYQRRRELQRGI